MRIESNAPVYTPPELDAALDRGSSEAGDLPSLDALTRLLLSLETQDRAELTVQSERIANAQGRLRNLQHQLIKDVAEALRHAQRAQHKKKKGGWFSRNLGGAVDLVAKVAGKGAEVSKDLLVVQADLGVSVLQNLDDPAALRSSIARDLGKLTESSETERATTGFLSGTAKFTGDCLAFQIALTDALARGAVRGDAAADLVAAESSRLHASFEQNIWHNPEFWTVVERSAQAAAVAGAVSSGGILGPAALALLLAIEADNRYGYLDDAVGRKAAPWVKTGMQVGVAAAAAYSGGSGNIVRYVQGATALLRGAQEAQQGVEFLRESRGKAAEIDANANLQETMNRMDQIRRLIDRLIETYEDQSEDQNTHRQLSAELAQAHAASHAAVVFPG